MIVAHMSYDKRDSHLRLQYSRASLGCSDTCYTGGRRMETGSNIATEDRGLKMKHLAIAGDTTVDGIPAFSNALGFRMLQSFNC